MMPDDSKKFLAPKLSRRFLVAFAVVPLLSPTTKSVVHSSADDVFRTTDRALRQRSVQQPPILSKVRGGGGDSRVGGGGGGSSPARTFVQYIAASRTRCWIVLILSIIVESGSSTLSKLAKQRGSASIFAAACSLYLLT